MNLFSLTLISYHNHKSNDTLTVHTTHNNENMPLCLYSDNEPYALFEKVYIRIHQTFDWLCFNHSNSFYINNIICAQNWWLTKSSIDFSFTIDRQINGQIRGMFIYLYHSQQPFSPWLRRLTLLNLIFEARLSLVDLAKPLLMNRASRTLLIKQIQLVDDCHIFLNNSRAWVIMLWAQENPYYKNKLWQKHQVKGDSTKTDMY